MVTKMRMCPYLHHKILPRIDLLLFELARRRLPCLHNKYHPMPLCVTFHSSVFFSFSSFQFCILAVRTTKRIRKRMQPSSHHRQGCRANEKNRLNLPLQFISRSWISFRSILKSNTRPVLVMSTKRNRMSYTAGKDGILTKILLFGKPNYTISEHYGSSISGFIRADNPDNRPQVWRMELNP